MEMEPLEIGNGNGNGNGHGHANGAVQPSEPSSGSDGILAPDAGPEAGEDVGRLASVVESLLFAAGAPVTIVRIVEALEGPSRADVLAALEALSASYERDGRGLRVAHVAGGYQLRTPAEHSPFVRRLLRERPPRLTRPMLETLAIIAYRQPCTRIEIEAVRGVDADAVLSTLGERRMVRIVGRKDAPGRPLLYATTREFLETFGLPDLGAMPPLRELGEGAELLLVSDLTVSDEGVVPTAEHESAPAEGSEPPTESAEEGS
jgi:segregation and condensation protein B